MTLSQKIKAIPIIGPAAVRLRQIVNQSRFPGSKDYWEQRYQKGGNSGPGSYGRLAHHKAEVINGIVDEFGVKTVIELGCGDGNQLGLAQYPAYHGFDISNSAIDFCRKQYAGRSDLAFSHMDQIGARKAELVLSLDVLYHLVEQEIFESYMNSLFGCSSRFVLIYAADVDDPSFNTHHVKTRKFSDWIAENQPQWALMRHVKNKYPFEKDNPDTSFADFYLYALKTS